MVCSSHACTSNTPTIRSYHIGLSSLTPPNSYTLVVSNIPSDSEYRPNSIRTIAHLQNLITSKTSIPLSAIYKLDTSLTLLPYHYLLLSSPAPEWIPLSKARKSNIFSPEQSARIDLQLGLHLRQLHFIQNDWFGLPLPGGKEPAEPSYSWQESFVLFLETILVELESHPANESGLEIPFEEIRKYLSRAIGFFLFDDVEVPSLIGFTWSDEDVLIALPSALESGEPRIAFLPLPTHALWADPMLETFLMPPGPSQALLEAYMDGRGPLIIFPRQRTKRVWYTLFLAGSVIVEGARDGGGKAGWAAAVIRECVDQLKDAPCY